MKLKKTITRPVVLRQKIVSEDGRNRGYRTTRVGDEQVTVEIVIDTDKLLDRTKTQLGNSIHSGKDKATLGYGAITATVINKKMV